MNFNVLQKSYWAQQIERVERVRQQITDRLNVTPGRTVPEATDLAIATGRRLSAAIMFLDISGFSDKPSETEEEQTSLMAALNLFFSEMIKIADDYGGTVEKNTGDGLMVYFEDGSSTTPENGSHHAVACALTMFTSCEHLINPILENSGIEKIQFRICIDHGNITISKMGAPKRFNAIVAIGTTANLASKMLSVAKAGELLLGESVKKELPEVWQNSWTSLHTYRTGWVYRSTNLPYSFYLYNGRWSKLI